MKIKYIQNKDNNSRQTIKGNIDNYNDLLGKKVSLIK